MLNMLRRTAVFTLATVLVLLAAHCAKPVSGEKDLLGKIKGKASLRLADGSTISRDDSDEYSPYLLKLGDGYLALVFASNRDCAGAGCDPGTHNIFMAKSTTPFDGDYIPYFDTPLPIQIPSTPLNSLSPVSYAAATINSDVIIYVNYSGSTYTGTFDPTNPTASIAQITNTNHSTNTIIGISADGTNLFSTDGSGTAYVFSPSSSVAANPYGYGMDYATSATQVRQENSGLQDSILGVYYGSSFTAAGQDYFGGILDLDLSLAASGLYLNQLSTFYTDTPATDTVLFSAWDGLSDDIYVITSHTSYDLWYSVPFFGFDQFLQPPPTPDHWYDFEFACPTATDSGDPGGWGGTCSGITPTTTSYNGTTYGPFNGAGGQISLGLQTLPTTFTIAAWVYLPVSPSCGTNCIIASNGAASTAYNGFKLFIDSTDMSLRLLTGDGSTEVTEISSPNALTDGAWYHIAAVINTDFSYTIIFVDGIPVGTTTSIQDTFPRVSTTIRFGTDNDVTVFLNADMDDVMIYEYELDPLAILSLASAY